MIIRKAAAFLALICGLAAFTPQAGAVVSLGKGAAGRPASSRDDRAQVNALFAAARAGELRALEGEPYFGEKPLIAVYDDPESDAPALSSEAKKAGEAFYGLDPAGTADELSRADALIVVWPEVVKRNLAVTDVHTRVTVIDPSGRAAYPVRSAKQTMAMDFGKKIGRNKIGEIVMIDYGKYPGFDPEAALSWISEKCASAETGDAARYAEAEALFKEEKYYSAKQAFEESGYRDWQARAAACVQEWPETGELWHDPHRGNDSLQLTIHVNQPDDLGYFGRISVVKHPQTACFFIRGTGEVTISLPESLYVIRSGAGTEWYGIREAFGKNVRYEKMVFDDNGSDVTYLQKGYSYTLNINISAAEAEGENVGSETESWEDFVE